MATTPNGRWSPDAIDGIDAIVANLAQMQNTNESADNATRALITAPSAANQAARDLLYPAPVQGNRVWRNDLGWEEAFFGAYNASTNPGGATPQGWYPVAGAMPKLAVWRSTSSALPNSGFVDWQWTASTIVENRGGFSFPAGSPTNIVVPFKGWYDVTFTQMWSEASGTGDRYLRIYSDGVAQFNDFNEIDRATVPGGSQVFKVMTTRIHVGSYFRTASYHTSPTAINGVNPKVIATFVSPSIV